MPHSLSISYDDAGQVLPTVRGPANKACVPRSAPDLAPHMTHLWQKRDALLQALRPLQRCAVAFSGGVDSAVVAKAAHLAMGRNALAVTGISASLSQRERNLAIDLASRIGIRHELLSTSELGNEKYRRNDPDRCYFCKSTLYAGMAAACQRWGARHLVSGTNFEDLDAFRPGIQAGREYEVHTPLATCGFTKQDVRMLARAWNLPVWSKPASPCLSSRIAYGQQVTAERLGWVERAESFLLDRGFADVRVRYMPQDEARIEVPLDRLADLAQSGLRAELVQHFRQIGFLRVTMDLEGLRSGNLVELVQLDAHAPERRG